jgi:hypothetical protein
MSGQLDRTIQRQRAKDVQDRDKLVQKEARLPKVRKLHAHTFLWLFSVF